MPPNTRTLKGQSYSTKRWANLAWPKGSKLSGFSIQRVQGPERLPERKKVVTAGEPGTAGKASTVGAAAGQEKGEGHRNVTHASRRLFAQ